MSVMPDNMTSVKDAHPDPEGHADNLVTWDGPDDPANPRNWSSAKRNLHIAMNSLFALNANLAATMFAPGSSALAADFHVTSPTVQAMTVSLYILGLALGPLVLGPLSEVNGRLGVYHACNVVYVAFTVGCALSTDVAMFLVFRFVAGCAAAGPLSIGGGTIADVTRQEVRGRAMAMFTMGPLLGPVIGPIIGGFVTERAGWRWTFRILIITTTALAVLSAAVMRETNATVLLQRKAARLRLETGNDKLHTSRTVSKQQVILRAMTRPFKLLVLSPIVLLVSLYAGIVFGLVFLLFATLPAVFGDVYGFDAGTAGLAYLGVGVGFVLALGVFSALSDRAVTGGDSRPERRLLLMRYAAPVAPLGCFVYGWTAQYGVHWIAPIVGTALVGFGSLFVIVPGQIYLVDAYGANLAASALAANLLIRCPFGAFLDLAAEPLYDKLGLGWGNSVLGFICLAFVPVPWFFYRYGERLRTRLALDV